MKAAVLLALLSAPLIVWAQTLPVSGSQHPPAHQELAWVSDGRVGWKIGPGNNGCRAVDPSGKVFDFVPRGDGKCYVEDAH